MFCRLHLYLYVEALLPATDKNPVGQAVGGTSISPNVYVAHNVTSGKVVHDVKDEPLVASFTVVQAVQGVHTLLTR